MPAPIPKVLYLEIKDGEVKSDAAGEQFLREYAAIRKFIKKTWAK